MFRRLTEAPGAPVAITVDGVRVAACAGDSVAAAMLAGGHLIARSTPVSGAPRAPYCLMGVCFDCLVSIDGAPNRQACMIPVREGLCVKTGAADSVIPPPKGEVCDPGLEPGEPGGGPTQPSSPVAPTRPPRSAQRSTSPSGGGIASLAPRARYDVAVVGAGPAGLAAARECARAGLDTVLLDEQATPGGQIWRAITASPLSRGAVLGRHYWRGEALVRETLASGAHYVPGANVWGLLREGELGAPQLSLPLAEVDGLPIGLSILACPGRDEMLLAFACRAANES
jgi:D-hydroxyproline dehydrogenase subunit gamma